MKIEFLFWEDCPSYPQAWERVQKVLSELDVSAEIEKIEVISEEDAERLRFPGSPTIRVSGQDVAGSAEPPYRLTCRLYFLEDGRPSPLPSEEMIRNTIINARAKGAS